MYDQAIKPMREEIESNRKYMTGHGFDPAKLEDDVEMTGNAIRQRVGKDTAMDKLLAGGRSSPAGTKSLSQKAGTFNARSFKALEDEDGRKVVYVDPDDNIFDAKTREKLGRFDNNPGKLLLETALFR